MNLDWSSVLVAVLSVFGVAAIGGVARHFEILKQEAMPSLMALLIWICVPAFFLNNIVGNEALQETSRLVMPPLVGFGTTAMGFVVAGLFAWWLGKACQIEPGPQRRSFVLGTGMYNYGYIPIPLIMGLFEEYEAILGTLFVHNMGVDLCMWTLGVFIVSGKFDQSAWKRIINPPSVAIVVALVLNLVEIREHMPLVVEAAVFDVIGFLGAMMIPLAMILIGATIYTEAKGAKLLAGGRMMVSACVLRLGVLPAMMVGLAVVLPVHEELKQVMMIEAAMAAAMFPIILSRIYRGDPATAMRITVITSLCSIVTMPMWLMIGMSFL